MPDEVRNLCRLADISSKSLLLQIVRQDDPQKMIALVEKIASQGGATREAVRKETAKPKAGRPKHYVFSYKAPTKAFNLKLSFTKSPRRPRRSHRGARGHHRRAQSAVGEPRSRGLSSGLGSSELPGSGVRRSVREVPGPRSQVSGFDSLAMRDYGQGPKSAGLAHG